MFGLGTLINTATVILGSLLGLLIKKGIPEKLQKTLMQGCGISTIFIGVSGVLSCMLKIENNTILTQGTMLLIISLILGGLAGELCNIEKGMDNLGERIKKLFKANSDNKFVEGFVTASLIMCVGAMAIVGSIEDGLSGNYQTLLAKAILDGVIALILSSTYGIGVIFSAFVILVYQGLITLIAHFVGSFISDGLTFNLSFVGSALIFCIGVNLAFGKKIKVGNFLPALLIPIFYELIMLLF